MIKYSAALKTDSLPELMQALEMMIRQMFDGNNSLNSKYHYINFQNLGRSGRAQLAKNIGGGMKARSLRNIKTLNRNHVNILQGLLPNCYEMTVDSDSLAKWHKSDIENKPKVYWNQESIENILEGVIDYLMTFEPSSEDQILVFGIYAEDDVIYIFTYEQEKIS